MICCWHEMEAEQSEFFSNIYNEFRLEMTGIDQWPFYQPRRFEALYDEEPIIAVCSRTHQLRFRIIWYSNRYGKWVSNGDLPSGELTQSHHIHDSVKKR